MEKSDKNTSLAVLRLQDVLDESWLLVVGLVGQVLPEGLGGV